MPINDLVAGQNPSGAPLVRTEPIQERSAARIDALLDAAAEVVDEIGFDRLTTAMVAERAGASIGTVYRYFPDRIVLLQALRDRALQRYRGAVVEAIHAADAGALVERRRVRDRRVRRHVPHRAGLPHHPFHRRRARRGCPRTRRSDDDFFAHRFAEILSDEFGLPAGEDLNFRLEIVVEISDSLISRAFLADPNGDERFIAEARVVAREYLAKRYGDRE